MKYRKNQFGIGLISCFFVIYFGFKLLVIIMLIFCFYDIELFDIKFHTEVIYMENSYN